MEVRFNGLLQSSIDLTNWNDCFPQPASPWTTNQLGEGNSFFRTRADMRMFAPDGMVWIPEGSFAMGDAFAEGDAGELPVHTVYVSGFFMDRTLVTKAHWDEVYQWAIAHGYDFYHSGSGKAAEHPVHTVDWFEAVKWCNALSEREGRQPAYYQDEGLTQPSRRYMDIPYVNWNAAGYRLPTEAEWEKAARGGAASNRYPWGNTITHNEANYGYDPVYATGGQPYTSPVTAFAAYGWGLRDMAGNLWEWCWDVYDSGYYTASPTTDPRGPESGTSRVTRGGSWSSPGSWCRVAYRLPNVMNSADQWQGFRTVLPGPKSH